MPADVITMYSQVDIVDAHTGRRQTLTVCYPEDAEPSAGFISALSPVGCSLLGQRRDRSRAGLPPAEKKVWPRLWPSSRRLLRLAASTPSRRALCVDLLAPCRWPTGCLPPVLRWKVKQ